MRLTAFFLFLSFPFLLFSQSLRVSENHRCLVDDKGEAFFWLGDTGWEMLHKLNREEIDYYLKNRAEKGFTVIQTVILAELDGLSRPNRENQLPLVELDPEKPNDKYFELVDYAVKKAGEYGLVLGLLPTWGSYIIGDRYPGPGQVQVFNEKNARVFGEFLGSRYRNNPNIVWILGGDRPADELKPVWDAMAEGLEKGDGGSHLLSYHPRGQESSSTWFHDTDWLDFHMIQTGHLNTSFPVYDYIEKVYTLENPKPVLNAEPAYEGIGMWFNSANPRFDDYEIRKQAYWSVFAGAFGHTYGNNNIWQMNQEGYQSVIWADTNWKDALEHPGAGQLHHLKELMLSRPFINRIAANDLISGNNPSWSSDHQEACRDGSPGKDDASYIMLYIPIYRSFKINTSVLDCEKIQITWFDPSTGNSFDMGVVDNTGSYEFSNWNSFIKEGQGGPDWVVVFDDPSRKYSEPGDLTGKED